MAVLDHDKECFGRKQYYPIEQLYMLNRVMLRIFKIKMYKSLISYTSSRDNIVFKIPVPNNFSSRLP